MAEGKSPSDRERPYSLHVQPGYLSIRTHLGARISGSFQILPAGRCKGIEPKEILPEFAQRMPAWVHLSGPQATGQQGLAWEFTLDTSSPGQFGAWIRLPCDTGDGLMGFWLTVQDTPPLADVAIWNSPFDCHTDWHSANSLLRLLDALPFRLHCQLPAKADPLPRTLLLHGGGLLDCRRHGQFPLVRDLVASGMRLVVLADDFYSGTGEAANELLEPFGLRMHSLGEGGRPGPVDGSVAFDVAGVCSPGHPLLAGVGRTHWHRPCTIDLTASGAAGLIPNPLDPSECFAAAAGPDGRVVLLGTSLWCNLSSTGWPFDNDRLLANLLAGGDAEQIGLRQPAPRERPKEA